MACGVLFTLPFLYSYFTEPTLEPDRHLQSLIGSAVLMIVGFIVIVIGLLADVTAGNRKLMEDLLYRVRMMELRDREERRDDQRPVLTSKDRWDR